MSHQYKKNELATGFTIKGGSTTEKTLTVTESASIDEAVNLSSKAPKASPTFTGTVTAPIIQNSQVDAVWSTGANTIATISGTNSHWIIMAHDKYTLGSYAIGIVVVNNGADGMGVYNILKAGDFATTGFSASGMNLQITNDGVALNGKASLLRIR